MDLTRLPVRLGQIARQPVLFQCNICGTPVLNSRDRMGRELRSCRHCHSTIRFRALIDALSRRLFGKSIPLRSFAKYEKKKGLGMTDDECYAARLAKVCDYRNTYFDRPPQLDISDLSGFPPNELGTFDFLISSDVFEHVGPSVEDAFRNAARLLKPGGFLVMTVPFTLGGETVEHFPELYQWKLLGNPPHCTLENTTRSGQTQQFTDLKFHGGEGFTLEMRVFTLSSLLTLLEAAGFDRIQLHGGPVHRYGIEHLSGRSFPITAQKQKEI